LSGGQVAFLHSASVNMGTTQGRGTTGLFIGDRGYKPRNLEKPLLFPRMFPRFVLPVNVWLCTPLQRKSLIHQ
jgi:hypothetical protein